MMRSCVVLLLVLLLALVSTSSAAPIISTVDSEEPVPQPEFSKCSVCQAIAKKAVDWLGCGGAVLSYKDCLALIEDPLAAVVCVVLVKELKGALDDACHKYTNIAEIENWVESKVCHHWCNKLESDLPVDN